MAEESKLSRFNGKRLSRKIIPISVMAIILVAFVVFISKYGVNSKTPDQLNKEQKEKVAEENSVNNSKKVTEDSAREALEMTEESYKQKKLKEKNIKDKEDAETKRIEEMLAKTRSSEYPSQGLPDANAKIEQYAQRKAALYQPSISTNMAVYENFKGVNPLGIDLPTAEEAQSALPSGQDAAEIARLDKVDEQDVGDVNAKFKTAVSGASIASPIIPTYAPSKFMVMESTTLSAVLMSAIDSQLPNGITAKLTEDIYDSINHEYLLIPKGSTISGTYNTGVVAGQDRVFVVFKRLIMPTGASVDLGATPGGDAQGRGGIQGNVSNEFWKSLGSTLLIATVGALSDQNQQSTVNNFGGSGGGISSSAGQILANAAKAQTDRFAAYRPKITVKAGEKLTIVVTRDMYLDPYKTFKGPEAK